MDEQELKIQEGITEGQLKNYRVLRFEYDRLTKALYKLYKDAGVKANRSASGYISKYGDAPRPSNKQPVLWFSEALKLIEDKSQTLIENIKSLEKQMDRYEKVLLKANLSEVEHRYARLRYFEGYLHQDTADMMHYTKNSADKIRVRVLKKFSNININLDF